MTWHQAWLVIAVGCTIAALVLLVCAYLARPHSWMDDDPAAPIEAPELECDGDG